MSTVNEILNVTVDHLSATFQVRLLHLIEHTKLLFATSIYEARIACTIRGKPISIFDLPIEILNVLIDEYHNNTKSRPHSESKLKEKNLVTGIKTLLHLYLREKPQSSFFSSIDVITVDELSGEPVGRTKIELDADIINFVVARQSIRYFGLLFLLHQTNVALVVQQFRDKGQDLRNWIDRAGRITKYFSVLTGIAGPVILNNFASINSSNYEFLLLTLSYIGVSALWYRFAPELILRLLIRIVVKKIME